MINSIKRIYLIVLLFFHRNFPKITNNNIKQNNRNTNNNINKSKILLDKVKLRQFYCMKIAEENHKKFYKKIRLLQSELNMNNQKSKTIFDNFNIDKKINNNLEIINDYSNNTNEQNQNESFPKKAYNILLEEMKFKWESKIKDISTDFTFQINTNNISNVFLPKDEEFSSCLLFEENKNKYTFINDYQKRKENYFNNQRLKEILSDDEEIPTHIKVNILPNNEKIAIDYKNKINLSFEINSELNHSLLSANDSKDEKVKRQGILLTNKKKKKQIKLKKNGTKQILTFYDDSSSKTDSREISKKELEMNDKSFNNSLDISVKSYNTNSIIDTSDSCDELFL